MPVSRPLEVQPSSHVQKRVSRASCMFAQRHASADALVVAVALDSSPCLRIEIFGDNRRPSFLSRIPE
eukprot:4028815-Pyramimonas_sp.AAC.1